jgi:DNA-binding NarL/FixJ family response regulator
MATHRPRILVADDHALVAEGIAGILCSSYDVVGISPNGRQLLQDADRIRPDLITLDIGMSLLNGLEAAKQLMRSDPRRRIIFVTQHVDMRYMKAAMATGALGFVAKQSASSELLVAVRRALAGRTYITPLLENLDLDLTKGREKSPDDVSEMLTPRQREVLQLIAEGHTARAISQTLSISPKTVEFHKATMMTALGLRTTAELIRYAVSAGVIQNARPE